jgi:hypothetical protein
LLRAVQQFSPAGDAGLSDAPAADAVR